MSLWISVTILAAFMQNLRFMLQKVLRGTKLSTAGATFSRFLFSAPLVAIGIAIYLGVTGAPWPVLNGTFWIFAVAGGVAQIVATACVVALFARRNFSVGIVFAKTEVVLTALIGLVILGEGMSLWGVLAVAVGFVGVVLLSMPPGRAASVFNAAAGFGLASGALFGVSAVAYRGATLQILSDDPFLRAGVTLACVTAFQTLLMIAWLYWRDRDEIGRVIASWRVSSLVGITSMLGSFGWFTAFALQNAAYVKALGQIELLFTFLGSYFFFGERSKPREITGIALVVVSVFLVMAAF